MKIYEFSESAIANSVTDLFTDAGYLRAKLLDIYIFFAGCLGSGRKKLNGRVRPSRGRRESVRDCE